ncbi:MAG: DNA repair protein RecN [Clostridia bacterium]|nr:DNA repair protein RecN [Clostridia bacterium]
MLTSIYIENIALIKRLSLELPNGFCAFTGETGAGKSIIIDSLGLLCGARSDKDIIRTGEDEATVEGIFFIDDKKVLDTLNEQDITPEEDGSITISRKISRDGRSGAKINGRNVPLSRLKSAMSLMLSIHGQQDTQAFADTEKQLYLLDSFALNNSELNDYREKYKVFLDIKQKLNALNQDDADRAYRLDMLRYRINELRNADIKQGEKEELLSERKILANSEKIVTKSNEAYSLLYGRDGSATEIVGEAYSAVSSLIGIIPDAENLSERLENAKYELIDIAETVREYIESDIDNVQVRLDECETRLELIKKLESKYKVDSDEFTSLLNDWEDELSINENSEEEKEKLIKLFEKAEKELKKSGDNLTKTRQKAAKSLCEKVMNELGELDMPNVKFDVRFEEKEFSPNGLDAIEFLISANKGELPKPMAKIASGGELSRIMLCLKCVFADSESIGTLIFDEIDTGVSGRTSEKIGIRLKNASNGGKTQVICVTHSAILSAKADSHYKISKHEQDGRVITNVQLLDFDSRKNELARIMGGLNITDTVLKAAEEMLS